ncbi:MAG: preprotein translocase subunit SecE [Oscillospiraceae bacterium]|nr:preprotein translocase subunit SecE [Oscillospiraceae bacterium]
MAKEKDKKELAVSEKAEKAEKAVKAAKADKADKKDAKKKDSSKKQGKISRWFKDLKQEMKKVVWPSRKVVVANSIVVFAAMLGFAAYTFLLDKGFLWLFEKAISGKS